MQSHYASHSSSPAWPRLGFAAVAIVLLCGLLSLADPLGGDQSLFLIGAHAMHNGAVLYSDFWDLKQPGVYAFYFAATALGGYSPVTLHIFELLYMLLLSVVLIVALRRSASFAPVAVLVPLTAVAFYYLAAGSYEQIQVETLTGLPLFVTLWLFCEGARVARPAARVVLFAGGGMAAAAVVLLKLVFLPVVAVIFCAALLADARKDGSRAVRAASGLGAAVAGFFVPMLAVAGFFAAHGALDAALQTWFVVPRRIVAEIPYAHESLRVLGGSLRWFLHRFYGMFILAAVGAFFVLRRKPDAFAFGLIGWLVAGTAMILFQVTSWFQYHWLLLLVPLGAFAAAGIRELYLLVRSQATPALARYLAAAALVVAAVEPATLSAHKLRMLSANGFAMTPLARERYREAESAVYAGCRSDAALIPPSGGGLYVLGNPTYYIVTNRLQAVAINGSSARLLLADQWHDLERELDAASPQYIYISHAISLPSNGFRAYLDRTYALKGRGTLGDVLARRDVKSTS